MFKDLPVHHAAIAYQDGLSILHNAVRHKDNQFFLKLDLQNFFPSIKYIDLLPKIKDWHKKNTPEWFLNEDAEELIRLACFYKNDVLGVEFPSSPIISNIVMLEFDTALVNLINNKLKFGDVVYSRYADDLIISTNKLGVSSILLKEISSLISKTKSPNITINTTKTKIGSSSGGTASVTGLKICDGGRITIHRKQKDHIRLLLDLYKKGMLKTVDYESLLGHLSYVHHVDSHFYTLLQK